MIIGTLDLNTRETDISPNNDRYMTWRVHAIFFLVCSGFF